jgi:two-component system sensor histidine kinase PilS (NtrC family)
MKFEGITGSRYALNWRVLGLLSIYRILISLVLLGLYSLGGLRGMSLLDPGTFFVALLTYAGFGLLCLVLVRNRVLAFGPQKLFQAAVDLVLLALILHASGGIAGGLGLLLLVPVGGLAYLVDTRSALFLASVAALVVLGDTIWQGLTGTADSAAYTAAGLLGLVLFVISIASSALSNRMRESEDLVRQRDLDLANLAELSQYIVQHLRESLLVVDAGDRIRLINESAAQILGDVHAVPSALLGEVSPRLLYSLSTWRQNERDRAEPPSSFVAADGARVIQPHFAPLGGSAPGPTLIFLEDTGLMSERVQQSKLAALGRLSASIAHEIRNPVGAMSHAAQLLAESPNIAPEEHRLTDIIRNNAERVSTIINNVLQLSRREATRPERLDLADWLEDFVLEFSETMQVPTAEIGLVEDGDDLEVRFDPSHLHQAVWNLSDNACKYGQPRNGQRIEIRVGRLKSSDRPYLEVCDRGEGIEPEFVDRIFEPFFTGRKGGTGLGLFISRELCQLNRAILIHEPRVGGGSVFRIVFTDPQRWEE